MKIRLMYIVIGIVVGVLWASVLLSLSVGSNTAVSRQAPVNFPAVSTNNTILGFADMALGFTLQSATATCTYDAFFPISGRIDMRGGRLHLRRDLVFDRSLNITSSGSFFAASKSIIFGKSIADLKLSTSLTFDAATVVFNNGTKINGPLVFRNSCKINGQGKRLTLQGNGSIIVRPGGNLVIENAELWGINQNNLSCLNDRGSITLRNSMLVLSNNYTFSQGSLLFLDDVIITGTNTPSKFIYSSGLTSTIASMSTLFLDYMLTLSYYPRIINSQLISMIDDTSCLHLNGCTLYSTVRGLQLSNGTLIADDKVTFSSEATSLNSALRLNSNLTIRVKGRGIVDLYGLVRYD